MKVIYTVIQYYFFLFCLIVFTPTILIAQNVAINGTGASPHPSAVLDLSSPNQGFLAPRVPDTNAVTAPAEGLLIYDLSSHCYRYRTNVQWTDCLDGFEQTAPPLGTISTFSCGTELYVGSLTVGFPATNNTIIIYYSGGDGGVYPDLIINSADVTGLTATLSAGTFTSGVGALVFTVTGTPTLGGTASFDVTIGGQSCVFYWNVFSNTILSNGCNTTQTLADYGQLNSSLAGASHFWISRNLGASIEPNSVSDQNDAASGCYFQFNRIQAYGNDLADGTTTVNPAWTIILIDEVSDWLPSNDPCSSQLGSDWRIPTTSEYSNVITNGGWTTDTDVFNSELAIHNAGYLSTDEGILYSRGSEGYYWSSSEADNLNGNMFYFTAGNNYTTPITKSFGFPLRCLMEDTITPPPPPYILVGCTPSQTEVDYSTIVSSISGISQTWITRNLGASLEATSATDSTDEAAGCYFQFNRPEAYVNDLADGIDGVSPAWTITSISENSDWLLSEDPCNQQLGGDWRLPTQAEWTNVDANGFWMNHTDVFNSELIIHSAGSLIPFNGDIDSRGVSGFYWSSTSVNLTNGSHLKMNDVTSLVAPGGKAVGGNARCVKNNPPPPPPPTALGCVISQTENDYGTTYTTLSGTPQIWISRNLGATNQAISATDPSDLAAGCYFQFNRSLAYGNDFADGVETINPDWTNISISENSDWVLPNDPCNLQLGGDWRIPTASEWTNADANGSWLNSNHAFASELKLHNSGHLDPSNNGQLIDRSVNGLYWSSTQSVSSTFGGDFFAIASGFSTIQDGDKANVLTLRCLKDIPALPPVPSCNTSQIEADYGTVVSSLSGASKTWITRNLGAGTEALAFNDPRDDAAGCYYQFNRQQAYINDAADGNETVSPAWSITSISEISDWVIANDPCRLQLGGTWRIPTKTEWENVSGFITNKDEAYNSDLKLHAGGVLDFSDGELLARGVVSAFWCSNELNNDDAFIFRVINNQVLVKSTEKANGIPLRCLKD